MVPVHPDTLPTKQGQSQAVASGASDSDSSAGTDVLISIE